MMMNMMKKYKNDDEADYEYYHEDAIFLDNHEQQSDRIRWKPSSKHPMPTSCDVKD